MTPQEIRKWDKLFEDKAVSAETARARARIEIAAQLAELNRTLRTAIIIAAMAVLLLATFHLTGCARVSVQPQVGCSGAAEQATHPSAAPLISPALWPAAPGDRWVFTNPANGETTWLDFTATDNGVTMHISKSALATYWHAGQSAELYQAETVTNGQLWSPGSRYTYDGVNWLNTALTPVDGTPTYYYLPLNGAAPLTAVSAYRSVTEPGDARNEWPWSLYIYAENVDIPAYSGPAVVSHQCEGPNSEWEEKWYFAPNLGLVQIKALREGAGTLAQPLIIERSK